MPSAWTHRALFARLAAASLIAGWIAAETRAQSPRLSPYRPALRSFRYLRESDEFRRYDSVVSGIGSKRPGGDTAYYGNRLTEFQYFGAPGEGGYYDAWADYVRAQKLDPAKYQYRANRP